MKNRQFHFLLRKLTMPCRICVRPGDLPITIATKQYAQSWHPNGCECGGKGVVRITVGRIAEEIYVSRPRLNDVLNNTPGHGGRTRPKVVKFFEKNLPQHKAELLAALGWDDEGKILKPEKDES
ncbi:MAG: hypothetical protein KGL39_19595 [Patescibacteria group bacterium]|nr:hypothetical protein [Patescibacteria group bacterium]